MEEENMTRQVYLDELDKLHKKVIEMGTLIEGSLDQVEEALYKMNRKKPGDHQRRRPGGCHGAGD